MISRRGFLKSLPAAPVVAIVPNVPPHVLGGRGQHFPRYAWVGQGSVPNYHGVNYPVAQVWRNRERLEPQLWLA